MSRVLKVVVVLFAVALALVVGLIAYVAFVFDPNAYRDTLAEEVRAQTGRTLAIDGDVRLSFFPWVGLTTGAVTLGNAAGFGDTPFARVEAVDARVRLLPLLKREVEIDRVLLKGLEVNLARDTEGRSNWADLGGAPETGEEADRGRQGGPGGGLAALAINGVDVESATVTWDDRQSGVRHAVRDLNLKTGRIAPGAAFPLSLGADWALGDPALAGRLDLDGEVMANAAGTAVSIAGLTLRVTAAGDALPGGKAELRVGAAVAADLAAGTLELGDVRVSAYGIEAEGAMQVSELAAAPVARGTFKVREFNPRNVMQAIGIAAPETADASALTRASLESAIEMRDGRWSLGDLRARLDDSVISGAAGFGGTAPLQAELALDGVDLDRYLPPKAEEAKAAAGTPGAAAAAAPPTALRGLELQGRVTVGQLKASGLTVTDIEVPIRASGGVVRLNPLRAALYDGQYRGNVTLDARGAALQLRLDETLEGLQIGPLLRDLGGKEEKLVGRADLRAQFAARGPDADAFKRTLDGTASFRFSNGALKGVNIAQLLREAEAKLRGQAAPADSGPNQTDFTDLTGTLRVADGVARNDDLRMRSPLLRVTGGGSADLVRERLDYRLQVNVVGTLTGQGGKELSNLRGVTVPLKVAGTFDAPSYALDVESLVAERAKGEVKRQIEKQLGDNVDETLRRGLEGLFR